jgi:hypothetical protein
VGEAGVINYKVDESITFNEACVWTILVPNKELINVRLVDDGFYPDFESIGIYKTKQRTRYQFRESSLSL